MWDAPEQRQVFSSRRMWWNEEQDILDIIGGAKERLLDAANGPFRLLRHYAGRAAVFPIWINCLPSKANRCLFHFGMVRVADMIPVSAAFSSVNPALNRRYRWRLLVALDLDANYKVFRVQASLRTSFP